jgi:hypothetical protein
MNMLKLATITAAAALVLVTAVAPGIAAAQSQGSDEARRACTPDVFRLCSEFIPDAGKITACLKAKRDQLSPACAKVFGKK